MSYLEKYYNSYDEEGRLLSRHGQVEYLTTMKYIRECLAGVSEPKILEVGAGTGRYSVTLAKQGYRVTAVALVAHNLELQNWTVQSRSRPYRATRRTCRPCRMAPMT